MLFSLVRFVLLYVLVFLCEHCYDVKLYDSSVQSMIEAVLPKLYACIAFSI